MANSIIDDMMKEPIQNENPDKKSDKKTNKKSKLPLILLLLILILAVLAGTVIYMYFQTKEEITPKAEFFEYLAKSNLDEILNLETYNTLLEKLSSENSHTATDISFELTSPFVNIEDVNFSTTFDRDVENDKSYAELELNYLNNNIADLKMLTSSDSIAIKSDEIVSKYVGSKYENLGRVIGQILGEDFKFNLTVDTTQVESLLALSPDVLDKYKDVIKEYINSATFATKNVTLSRTSGNLDTVEYSMYIDEQTLQNVIIDLLKVLESDYELLNCLISDETVSVDDLSLTIESLIVELSNNEVDSSKNYGIKVYVNSNKTVKVSFDLAGEVTIDIDYEYGEKENSALITILEVESNDALTINLTKKVSDVSENLIVTVDIIESGSVIAEIELDSNIYDNRTSYEITNKITANYSGIKATLDINGKISFKSVDIEDLDEDNCLFMDTLDTDTFNDVVEAIGERTQEVISEKASGLSETTNYSTIIEQPDISSTVTLEKRSDAKQKLYDSVASAMGDAIARGEEYTILDLENLEIPDSTVSVSVNEDIAIVIVDGYEFTIDSDFNLSD